MGRLGSQPAEVFVQYICAHLLFAALFCMQVKGHGYMFEPASRNWLGRNSNPVITYTPHGGNGRGVCGDPFEGGGEAFATMAWGRLGTAGTFSPGQRVTIKMKLTANHGGRFSVQLCDRTSNLDHACFSRFLTRADVPGERYWWMFSSTAGDFSMDYVFPTDFSCPNSCVMRWEYIATQTCVPPGCDPAVCRDYSKGGNYGVGTSPGLCTDGLARTEPFYNCADITISGTVPPASGCTTTCATPTNACQTGGGCNTVTRTCNPITFLPSGTTCPGGSCINGVCQASGCPTTCPTANACQTGGGCNTVTRTCNPIVNRANGSPCTGGTCQNGVCSPTTRCTSISTNGACGNGVCCPTGNCCSQWGWCGTTSTHCTGCQATWSGIGSVCNGVRISSVATRRRASLAAAAHAAATNSSMAAASIGSEATSASVSPAEPTVTEPTAVSDPAVMASAAAAATAAVASDPMPDTAATAAGGITPDAASVAGDDAGTVMPPPAAAAAAEGEASAAAAAAAEGEAPAAAAAAEGEAPAAAAAAAAEGEAPAAAAAEGEASGTAAP